MTRFKFIAGGTDTLQELCRLAQRWGLYLSASDGNHLELQQAAPYLSENAAVELWNNGAAYLLFDNEEACYEACRMTKGDDGPLEANPYKGKGHIFAVVCNPTGELEHENT